MKQSSKWFRNKGNVKNAFDHLFNLYKEYTTIDLKIKDKFEEEIEDIKKQTLLSKSTTNNINNVMRAFNSIVNYSEKKHVLNWSCYKTTLTNPTKEDYSRFIYENKDKNLLSRLNKQEIPNAIKCIESLVAVPPG